MSSESSLHKQLTVPKELLPYLTKIKSSDYLDYLDKYESAEVHGSRLRHYAGKLVRLPGFEHFMGSVIVINLIVMIIETDNAADNQDTASDLTHWTEIFGWVVLLLFVFELTVRMIVSTCMFWKDTWNTFDFIVVALDFVFSLAGLLGNHVFPVSILRIFRLAKLARVFKVLRVFPQLRLLVTGLVSAISAIFWGTVLLLFSMLIWALIAVQFIHPLNRGIEYHNCERCPRAYSSVLDATLTFWQAIVTGDSWGQATIPVIEKHPGSAIFFVSVYLSVGMAVTNLILGVVVNVAQQAQDALLVEEKTEQTLRKLEQHTHLLKLCKEMDSDGSGLLSQGEVYAAFEVEGDFRESILALDISKEEFDIIWTIMDQDGNGSVSYKELVSALSTVKSSDTHFMLAYIKYYVTTLKKKLDDKLDDHHDNFKDHHQEALSELHEKIVGSVAGKAEEDLSTCDGSGRKDFIGFQDYELFLERSEALIKALGVHGDVHRRDQAVQVSDELTTSEVGKKVLQTTVKQDSPGAPVPPSFEEVLHSACGLPGMNASNSATLADKLQMGFNQVHLEIATFRVEFMERLAATTQTFVAQVAAMSPPNPDNMRVQEQPDLLVVPTKTPTCSLFCEPEGRILLSDFANKRAVETLDEA